MREGGGHLRRHISNRRRHRPADRHRHERHRPEGCGRYPHSERRREMTGLAYMDPGERALTQVVTRYQDTIKELRTEILALSQETDRLREALAPFAEVAERHSDDDPNVWPCDGTTLEDARRARAALNKEPPCQET